MTLCVFCNRQIQTAFSLAFLFSWKRLEENLLCSFCCEKFEEISPETACVCCGRRQHDKQCCQDCQKWQTKYPQIKLQHTALYVYNEMAREYMDQYKFQGDLLLASVFKQQIRRALKVYLNDYSIVPVPLSRFSQKTRGFNQVEWLLQSARIPYQNLLKNQNQEALQSSKNRRDRLKTPQPFQLADDKTIEKNLKKKILIVDDVYTTGRTILHARQLLSERLPADFEIRSFSLFR